jgi:hypothetical protein
VLPVAERHLAAAFGATSVRHTRDLQVPNRAAALTP